MYVGQDRIAWMRILGAGARGGVRKERKKKMWGGGYLGDSSVDRDKLGVWIIIITQ